MPKKAPFRAKNPAFCRYHSCAAAPRRHLQARGEETADGEVNRARTKRRLFLRRCLSATTMSHSSAPRWALINSNFTFWPTSPLRSAPQPLWSSGSSPLRCPPDPAINVSCRMTSASVHVSNLALPFLLRKTSHFYSLALTHDIWVSSFVPLVLTKEFHILKWLIGYESYLFGACGHFLGGLCCEDYSFFCGLLVCILLAFRVKTDLSFNTSPPTSCLSSLNTVGGTIPESLRINCTYPWYPGYKHFLGKA